MSFNFCLAADYRLNQLKKDVKHVLKKHPEGIPQSEIWALVTGETGRRFSLEQYDVKSISDIFEKWTDDIIITDLDNPRLFLKDKSLYENSKTESKTESKPAPDEPAATGLMAEIKRRTEKAGISFPSTSNTPSNDIYKADQENDDESDDSDEDDILKSLPVNEMKEWVYYIFDRKQMHMYKLSKLQMYLRARLKNKYGTAVFKKNTCKQFLEVYCNDIVWLEGKRKSLTVYLRPKKEVLEIMKPTKRQSPRLTAMSLMTELANTNEYKSSSQKGNYISLHSDDKKDKDEVIDLTNEPEPSGSSSQKSTPTSKFGSFPVPLNFLQPSHGGIKPVKLGGSSDNVKYRSDTNLSNTPTNSGQGLCASMEGFQNKVIEIISNPIDTTRFTQKRIDIRPVHVPYGRIPAKEHVDGVAKECIEMLADANENVSMERVEKLICQRFGCHHVRQIGFQYPDQIPCIYELNRLLCKINLYIIAFVKSRSVCTLYELKEAIREYAPDKGEFESLKLGPLQRFPVVYQQFHFPPDLAEIPEITTSDILDHFHNFLTEFNLWSKKLELQPFMEYLSKKFEVSDSYMMGIKIRSLPLTAAVLKKAKRDTAIYSRQFVQHFKDETKNQMQDAFRKFRASIIVKVADDKMEIRQHYLKMRPELAILEIFEKFNVLLTVTQSSNRKWTKNARFRMVVEEFLTAIRSDELCQVLFHLSICMTNTEVSEAAIELLVPQETDSDDGNEQGTSNGNKPPPRKDALIESARTYIERCLNAGAISLTHLDRIEEKMLEDFGFNSFNAMGFGRFIEFLLLELKQLLEESGGLTLGTGSGGIEADSTFKPELADILDFIKQCKQCGKTEPDQMKEALCNQYNVKEVRHLGYGNITRLLSYADKHGRHTHGECSVLYESTLVQSTGQHACVGSKVGILGHQSRDDAKICLHNCPLLENLADWSQWSLVFEPELGKLKDFVHKYGGVTTKTLEGGKLATYDFLALETRPGEFLKIVSSTSPDHVVRALEQRDATGTAGHLVSMAVAYKGVESMPLALLSGHVKTALLQMHSEDSSDETAIGQAGGSDQHIAAKFVLQCLLAIPTKICVALANQVFLDPLGHVVGSSKSKQLLVQLSKTGSQQNRLVQLGCLLGIPEWTDMIQQKCQLPASAIEILPPEAEELLGDVTLEEDDDDVEMITEDGEDDVDEILAGDLCNDRKEAAKTGTKDKIKTTVDEKVSNSIDLTGGTEEDIKAESVKTKQCEEIVKQIRRDEFGVGVHLSEDGQRLMKIQQERLGRSLERLSKDLYSKDTHFVLELVQNADDNSYHDNLLSNATDDCPSVKFVIEHDGINVMNNELGFSERDVRALCDVGRSTKGKHKFGYIGQKGIGFKSVFRITDAPEVHSNGYHIKFDVNSGPMGYILPHWVPGNDRIEQDTWMTHIKLGLKPDMMAQTRTLAARFNDIHPSLLLFLHRLREITIENKVEGSVQTMRRRDVGDNVIEIQHTHGSERWLVIKKMLDASKISVQAKSGADVESTEIALAFPIIPQAEQNLQSLPPKQPVFAFLPLRSYGFRFIVQGDFDVPSSREDVDRDSPWNQWLRSEIHTAFVEALDVFKTHGEFNSIEAVCRFLQFVPMEDEVLDFFKPVALDILKKLRAKPCVPTQPNDQGVISWKIPSQTVITRDPLVRSVITPDLLQTHLNLFYLHSDLAAVLNPSLSSCLGISFLTSDHLFQLGKALVLKIGTQCKKEEDITLISRWMACLYRSLDEFHHEDSVLNMLKSHPIMPLATGELVALQDKTVFYPIDDNSKNKRKNCETLSLIQQDVNSLHPMLMKTDDDEVNSQVHKLLLRLGIKQLTPFDVINHHILPALKSNALQTKSEETLVAYLVYIKEQTENQPSVCNLEEVKDVAMVMTNQGFKIPAREPVHFPPQYGNPVDLKEMFFGHDWTLLSDCYLPKNCSNALVASWMEFFKKLDVEEFLSVRQTEIRMTRDELVHSPWSEESLQWPVEKSEFIIHDYHCAELEGLIMRNKTPSGENYANQMKNLCIYLDDNWKNKFSRYCVTHVHDKDGVKIKEIDTSFSILLKTASWLPATQVETSAGLAATVIQDQTTVIKGPSSLYIKSAAVKKLLSDKVLYLDIQLKCEDFIQYLGLKNSVPIETMKDFVMKWGERKTDNAPSNFCSSLEHMVNVYSYLGKEMKRNEFQELLREQPVFFVPNKSSDLVHNNSEVLVGKMLRRNEIWLSDPTGLFEKHRQILEEFNSEICQKRTIQDFYKGKPELIELFSQEGKLDLQPKVEEYLELLCLLCNTCTPKESRIVSDVLYIFSVLGGELIKLSKSLPEEQTTNVAREALESTIKTALQKKKVFPTIKHIWVSLEDVPLINDDNVLSRMFKDKPGIHFLDMEVSASNKTRKKKGKSLRSGHKGSRISQEKIDELLEVCGIEKISDVVDSEPVPDLIEPCQQMKLYFSRIVPYIQQYLKARFPEVYQDMDPIKTRDLLKDSKFFQAGKLEVRYWLTLVAMEVFVIQEQKCKISMSEFYFQKDHLNDMPDIQMEAARYFSGGDGDCYTTLRSFLSELSNAVTGVTNESVQAVLSRHEVHNVDVPDEEKWYITLADTEMANKSRSELLEYTVEPGFYQYPESEFGVSSNESSPFVMRQWPPLPDYRALGPGGDQKPRGKQAEEAAKYRRSVRDLPTNVRLVDDDGEETGDKDESAETGTRVTGKRKLSISDEEVNAKKQSPDLRRLSTENEDNNEGQRSKWRHYEGDDTQFTPDKIVTKGPSWNQKVADYTEDELGTSKDIPVARILDLKDKDTDSDFGYWGEQFVDLYLNKQKEIGEIIDFKWRNKDEEAGFPFDFEVQVQCENGIRKDYIEVKSTQSNDKEVFQVSVQQIKFAEEKKERYHIYRVFNAGSVDKVRLVRITNLDMRLTSKQVKLCMVI